MKRPFNKGDRVTLRTKEDILTDKENFYVWDTLKGRKFDNLRDKATRFRLPDSSLELLGNEVTIKCAMYDGTFYNLKEDSSIYPATMFVEYFDED